MNVNLNAAFQITGTSTTGLAVSLTPTLTIVNETVSDYFHDAYAVHAGTTATAMNMGSIITGEYLMISTDGPLTVTLTQTNGDVDIIVDTMLIMTGEFTGIQVANATSSTVNLTVLILGSRTASGTTPGVYSA